MSFEMLEVVDENDNVIGTASRKEIHKEGLRHREVNVFFIRPNGELIFQRRSKTKDTYPGLLDVTVGGHVEIGDSYDETALKEIAEEAGVTVNSADLIFLDKVRTDEKDALTGAHNCCFRAVYAYRFAGTADDLIVEDGAATGFETYPLQSMFSWPADMQQQFVPRFVDPVLYTDLYSKIEKLIAA